MDDLVFMDAEIRPNRSLSQRGFMVLITVVTVLNCAGIGAIVWRLHDAQALKWLGLGLVGANVVTATLYLAGATVTDWAKLAHAARSAAD